MFPWWPSRSLSSRSFSVVAHLTALVIESFRCFSHIRQHTELDATCVICPGCSRTTITRTITTVPTSGSSTSTDTTALRTILLSVPARLAPLTLHHGR